MSSKNEILGDWDFFKETILLYHDNFRKFMYRYETHTFSIFEKKLLEAFLFYRKNKKSQALQLIKNLSLQSVPLEAFRCYLMGIIYNQHGHFYYSLNYLEKSIEFYHRIQETELIVDPQVVLALARGNRRELKEMSRLVDDLKSINTRRTFSKIQVLYVEAVFHELSDNLLKAKKVIEHVEKKFNTAELKSFAPFFNVITFSIGLKNNNFSVCYESLEKYKGFTGTNVKANYSYMKSLLDHLAKGHALYVYPSEFCDFPELYHQLEVIKAFSLGDIPKAKIFWSELQKHNPQLYAEGFKFLGDKCLFSLALDLYSCKFSVKNINLKKLESINTVGDRLIYILESSKSPVSKGELVRLIWNEELDEKNGSRLRTLISWVRKERGLEIRLSQSTYYLVTKLNKAS